MQHAYDANDCVVGALHRTGVLCIPCILLYYSVFVNMKKHVQDMHCNDLTC